MRENKSIWDSVQNGWCVCGGMVVPPNSRKIVGGLSFINKSINNN